MRPYDWGVREENIEHKLALFCFGNCLLAEGCILPHLVLPAILGLEAALASEVGFSGLLLKGKKVYL